MEAHRQYDLRSRKNQDKSKKGSSDTAKTPDTILKKAVDSNKIMVKKTDQNKDKAIQTSLDSDAPITSTKIPEMAVSKKIPKQSQQTLNIEKVMAEKTEAKLSKLQGPFSFEGEITKIKITMPLTKLITQSSYKSQVLKALNIGNDANTLNLADDTPEVLFGPKIEGKFQ